MRDFFTSKIVDYYRCAVLSFSRAVLALSTHAIFEGLAAGLEHHPEDVWTMFAAIASHKFVISFCVCLEFLQHGAKKALFFTYLIVFSLMSSAGIAIGIIITENEGSSISTVASATLEGIAGGTIIYVVMFEILNRERAKDIPGLLQFVAIIVGFVIMMLIQIFGNIKQLMIFEEFQEIILQRIMNTTRARRMLGSATAFSRTGPSSILSSQQTTQTLLLCRSWKS